MTILKASNKSVWRSVFWYVKVCIFWNCIQYTIHWDKTQILNKKSPWDKISGSTKNAIFFLSRAPTHHSFIFNLRFLHELKHKVRLSKIVCGIFHFRFRFVFIGVYIFVQQNPWTPLLQNVILPFKIKIIEKPQSFAPRPLIFKFQQEVWKLNICVNWSSPKIDLETNFLNQWKRPNSNF